MLTISSVVLLKKARTALALLVVASVMCTTGCLGITSQETQTKNHYTDSEYNIATFNINEEVKLLLEQNDLIGSSFTVEEYSRLGKLTNEQIYMFCRLKPYESETFLKAQGYNSIEEYYKSLGFETKYEWEEYSKQKIVENY